MKVAAGESRLVRRDRQSEALHRLGRYGLFGERPPAAGLFEDDRALEECVLGAVVSLSHAYHRVVTGTVTKSRAGVTKLLRGQRVGQ